jgi:hypothetical protein
VALAHRVWRESSDSRDQSPDFSEAERERHDWLGHTLDAAGQKTVNTGK